MKHAVSLTLTLFGLWLLLSGHFDPLLITLGVASSLLTLFLALRMEVIDHESLPLHLTRQLPKFWFFLVREIILANVDVIRRILTPGKSYAPQLIQFPVAQKTVLGKVIYANAVTLTPGTVTVQLDSKTITVHALSREAAGDLQNGRLSRSIPDNLQVDKA